MKQTPLKRISEKQRERNRKLSKIKRPEHDICQECGMVDHWRLQKHHIKFRSDCGGDEEENIEWLCGKCSSKKHGIKEV